MYDLLLKNGLIVDGSGAPAFHGDIAVSQGKIAEIAPKIDAPATEVVDVHGAVIAPGFIDMHSHGDNIFLADNRCQSKVYQGVTTEVAGQCGSTVYPCKSGHLEDIMSYGRAEPIRPYVSESLAEFIEKTQRDGKKMSTNLVSLIGHGALRAGVMGYDGRKATPEELNDMKALLDREMEQGAWGLSLGLGYAPGVFSDQEELNALGEVVAKYDGIITSHMRNQGAEIIKALDEMYEINRQTGARVHIAHLKASGKTQFGWGSKVWKNIEDAQAAGIAVTADMYPYTASSTGITNILPKWTLKGGVPAAAARLEEGSPDREVIMEDLAKRFETQADGEALRVVDTNGRCPEADGKNIYQLSQLWDCSMPEAAARLIVQTKGAAPSISFCMSEDDVLYFLKQEVAIGSDGRGMPLDPALNQGKPHPRNFGTFPRFLRLAREHQLCSLEDAVRRMTSLPASIVHLTDRGLLKSGMVADITVFDADTIADGPTFDNPFQKNTGILHVIMGGEFALKDGEQTELRLGKFLKKN